ncbi:MAG TPA: hypothetical protein VLK33_18150, partial [Terriglobales bacterium]|nr:hypothetical protein [Terriglobales bacterium]
KSGFRIGGALFGVFSAMKKNGDNQDWLDQLDALEDCVKNPRNTLTQQEYGKNPTYQEQTLSGLANARSQVQQVTAARFLGQLSSTGAGLLMKGPWKAILGGVNFLNDMTLKDVANQQIIDIAKSVDCKEQTPLLHHGDGTIVYRLHKNDSDNITDSLIQGVFTLHPGPVEQALTLAGTGEVQSKTTYAKDGSTYTCKGINQIHGTGGMGMLRISSEPVGNCIWNIQGKVTQHPMNASTGITCSFSNVDTVNGGSYEVQEDGENSQWGKCELELKPTQKK